MIAPRPGVTIHDAAAHFNVSERTIRRWIQTGTLRAERLGPLLVRIDLDSIQTSAVAK